MAYLTDELDKNRREASQGHENPLCAGDRRESDTKYAQPWISRVPLAGSLFLSSHNYMRHFFSHLEKNVMRLLLNRMAGQTHHIWFNCEKMAYITDELDKNRREVRFRREIALSERVSIANESKFLLRSTASSASGSYRKSVFVEPQLHVAIFFSFGIKCNAFVIEPHGRTNASYLF